MDREPWAAALPVQWGGAGGRRCADRPLSFREALLASAHAAVMTLIAVPFDNPRGRGYNRHSAQSLQGLRPWLALRLPSCGAFV